ncbi:MULTISPECIES: MarR family winged helix-turn-helix transcriptional regulator [unclassified Modestobacter]
MTQPVPPLDTQEEALLRAFARVWTLLPRSFEADLLREHDLLLGEYFALMNLSESPGQRLRMSELAAAAPMSLSGMTRVVQRLDAAGFVRRERSAEDGRGWDAVLTPAGLIRLQECWPTHLASVRRHLFDQLAGADLSVLTGMLRQLIRGNEKTPGESGSGSCS